MPSSAVIFTPPSVVTLVLASMNASVSLSTSLTAPAPARPMLFLDPLAVDKAAANASTTVVARAVTVTSPCACTTASWIEAFVTSDSQFCAYPTAAENPVTVFSSCADFSSSFLVIAPATENVPRNPEFSAATVTVPPVLLKWPVAGLWADPLVGGPIDACVFRLTSFRAPEAPRPTSSAFMIAPATVMSVLVSVALTDASTPTTTFALPSTLAMVTSSIDV